MGGPVAQISAGEDYVCAVLTAVTLRCWGDGTARLGYPFAPNSGSEQQTPASNGDVVVGF
jgi:hypothetical protein